MASIHQISEPGLRSEVDIFNLQPTDTTVDTSMYACYKPLVNTTDSNGKLEFKITGTPDQYLDFSDSFLYLCIKVENDAFKLFQDQDVSTCNNLLHSLFAQVEVLSNSKIISSSNNCYPYKAYIEKILGSSNDYLKSVASSAGFLCDTNNFDATTANEGYKGRKTWIEKSRTLELCDRLHIDLAAQDRYILNDMDFTVCLTRSSDKFVIIGHNWTDGSGNNCVLKAKVQITDASFYIRKQNLYPSVILAHQRLLDKGHKALYPISEAGVKFYTIPSGNQSFTAENVFTSSVPKRVILGLVSNAAFNGTYQTNPFKFHHYNLNYLSLQVNNVPVPCPPLLPGFADDKYLLPYWLLCNAVGVTTDSDGFAINRQNYKEGYTFFAFDIQRGQSNSLQLEKHGNVSIEMKFQSALAEAVNLVVYSEQAKVIEIDKSRSVE